MTGFGLKYCILQRHFVNCVYDIAYFTEMHHYDK